MLLARKIEIIFFFGIKCYPFSLVSRLPLVSKDTYLAKYTTNCISLLPLD